MNEEIERLRHAATAALLSRRDVLIVASVSCIYGLGSPEEYRGQILRPYKGTELPLEFAMQRLVDIQYQRNNVSRARGTFRVQGDTLEVFPPYEQIGFRIEWWGDTVERIMRFDPVTGELIDELTETTIFPATHYVAVGGAHEARLVSIEDELGERLAQLDGEGKLLEAERLRMRTNYDLEMMREVGFCSGIENYSRHIDGRSAGHRAVHPARLLPRRLPRRDRRVARHGARSCTACTRATSRASPTLVDFGFRLPSAIDNRPLRFDEFVERVPQVVFMSATPGRLRAAVSRRRSWSRSCVPPAWSTPRWRSVPTKGQVDDLIEEIRRRAEANQRVLVTTLTKKMAEDLTDYLIEMGIRVRYLHSEVDTLQRIEIVRDLRLGEFDVLVGHQPAAGGPRPARGLAGGHPRRRQGGVPALGDVADPDHRPRGAQRRRHGPDVRGRHHRLDEGRPSARRSGAVRSRSAYNAEHGIDPQTVAQGHGHPADACAGRRAGVRRPRRRSGAARGPIPRCPPTSSSG